MQRTVLILIIFFTLLISSCLTNTPQTTPQVVTVYSTSAATPWLGDVYCMRRIICCHLPRGRSVLLPTFPFVVGEPKYLTSFAYQIDEEEILIVTHRQSPGSKFNP